MPPRITFAISSAVVAVIAVSALVVALIALPVDRDEVETLVRDYLRDHPEAVVEAIRQFQTNEEAVRRERTEGLLSTLRPQVERDPTSPVGGNPNGNVTLVEFFDYACGFCKQVFPTVMELIKNDGNIRYVFKEYPILTPQSVVAARAALAAWAMDKGAYGPFHSALMSARGDLTEDKIFRFASESGLDVEALRRRMADTDIEDALVRNFTLAEELGINGTPAFVIGRNLVPGAADAETLKQLVLATREECQKAGTC
ncbi:MAG: DsbA family protein [Rhodospirillales bacterium]|nr:DsbA family protein [Rhodospirillales bacterium]